MCCVGPYRLPMCVTYSLTLAHDSASLTTTRHGKHVDDSVEGSAAIRVCMRERLTSRPELMRSRVLELNASDERGIAVVRDKIKSFARAAVSAPNPDYPSPALKIVSLYEAFSMTQDAHSGGSVSYTQYSRITRFCLICNYVSRIIDPVTSRCSTFSFKPLLA
mgnify:CR=1 FL=1